jgi:hypothetical protein
MRLIGHGLEYKVYDQGSGRVLKLRRSLPNRILASLRYVVRSRTISSWPGIVRILLPKVNTLPGLVARLATMSPETRKLFGNIEMAKGCDYTQDAVTPLRDYMAGRSLEENLVTAAEYVKLIKALWAIGVGDPYFNFQWNAGAYADGTVAQLDVADLVTEADILGEQVRRQIWHMTSLPGIGDEALRAGCARILNAELTHEVFLELWPKKELEAGDPEAGGKKRYFK